MKQCTACKTTYTDQTLRFCLADGTVLVEAIREVPTVVQNIGDFHADKTVAMAASGEQMRIKIPSQDIRPSPQTVIMPSAPTVSSSSGTVFKIILVVIGLGILAVLAVAVGALIYFNMGGPDKAVNVANKDVKTSVSPTPSQTKDDKDELRDQLANLEKLLNEQKKNNKGANVPLTLPNQPATTTSARVNSPGDGFLALRTMPSSESGARIRQIPHGAIVTFGGCLNSIRIGSKTGRWCRAAYDGYTGWVFDAFLVY